MCNLPYTLDPSSGLSISDNCLRMNSLVLWNPSPRSLYLLYLLFRHTIPSPRRFLSLPHASNSLDIPLSCPRTTPSHAISSSNYVGLVSRLSIGRHPNFSPMLVYVVSTNWVATVVTMVVVGAFSKGFDILL